MNLPRRLAVLLLAAAAAAAQAPPNDLPFGATPLFDPALVVDDNTPSAADLPPPTCALAASGDLWFYFLPAATGPALATTCPTAGAGGGALLTLADSVIVVYEDLGGAPGLELACSDDACTAGTLPAASAASFFAVVGTGYFISVSGAGGVRGSFALEARTAPCTPPPCDALGSPCPVVVGPVTGTSACAGAGAFGAEDVFLSLTVMGPKQVVVTNTNVTTFSPGVGVYDNLGPGLGLVAETSGVLGANGSLSYKITDCLTHTLTIGVRTAAGTGGPFAFNISLKYLFKITKPNGSDSLRIESHDGPPGGLVYMATTLDVLHPGLPAAASFPNGWFYGVPLGLAELATQLNFPGGLPFVTFLDAAGSALHLDLPAGATAAFAGARLWLVGVAFDPTTGFASIADVTDPVEEIL